MTNILGYIKSDSLVNFNNWLGPCTDYSETAPSNTLNDHFSFPNEPTLTINYTNVRLEKDGEVIAKVNMDLPDTFNPTMNSLTGIDAEIYTQTDLESLGWDFGEDDLDGP